MYLTAKELSHPGLRPLMLDLDLTENDVEEVNNLFKTVAERLEQDKTADISPELNLLFQGGTMTYLTMLSTLSAERYQAKFKKAATMLNLEGLSSRLTQFSHEQREGLGRIYDSFIERLDKFANAFLASQLADNVLEEHFSPFMSAKQQTLHSADLLKVLKKIPSFLCKDELNNANGLIACVLATFSEQNFKSRANCSTHKKPDEHWSEPLKHGASKFFASTISQEPMDVRFPKKPFERRLGVAFSLILNGLYQKECEEKAKQLIELINQNGLQYLIRTAVESAQEPQASYRPS